MYAWLKEREILVNAKFGAQTTRSVAIIERNIASNEEKNKERNKEHENLKIEENEKEIINKNKREKSQTGRDRLRVSRWDVDLSVTDKVQSPDEEGEITS